MTDASTSFLGVNWHFRVPFFFCFLVLQQHPFLSHDHHLLPTALLTMPRLRTSRSTPPPEGFEDIEQILDEYERKMRDAEADDSQNKRKVETLWPLIQINHTRSRYIYDLFYKREAISRELYDWLLKYQYADAK